MGIQRLHIAVILGLAVVYWFAVLAWYGIPVSTIYLKPYGTVIGLLTLTLLAVDYWLWHQKWLHGWLFKRPDLRGTWQVTIKSDWVNPETNEKVAPITGYVCINQTFFSLHMRLMTRESSSSLLASDVQPTVGGNGYQVSVVYMNKPSLPLRESKSRMHHGAMVIETHGQSKVKPDAMTAEYWTDRKTTGVIDFSRRKKEYYSLFDQALEAFKQ